MPRLLRTALGVAGDRHEYVKDNRNDQSESATLREVCKLVHIHSRSPVLLRKRDRVRELESCATV